MKVLLIILTIYANHSAQTTTVPMESVKGCRAIAAGIQKQLAAVTPPSGAEVYVITKCVEAK